MSQIQEYRHILRQVNGRRLDKNDMATINNVMDWIRRDFCNNLFFWNTEIHYNVGKIRFSIESIWEEDDKLMLHSDSPLMEADVVYNNLPNKTMYLIFRRLVKAIIDNKACPDNNVQWLDNKAE